MERAPIGSIPFRSIPGFITTLLLGTFEVPCKGPIPHLAFPTWEYMGAHFTLGSPLSFDMVAMATFSGTFRDFTQGHASILPKTSRNGFAVFVLSIDLLVLYSTPIADIYSRGSANIGDC